MITDFKTVRWQPSVFFLLALGLFSFNIVLGQTPAKNKTACQAFYDAFNQRDLGKIRTLLADDFQDHALPPDLAKQTGLKAVPLFEAALQDMFNGFPDLKISTIQLVAESDLVMAYISMSGTHQGTFSGIPATGKSFRVNDVDIVKFDKKGKAIEHWAIQDGSALLNMLGIASPTPAFGVVQQCYLDFARGNIPGLLQALSDDVVWTDPGHVGPYAGKRMGKESVQDFFTQLSNQLQITAFEARDFYTLGNKVAVTGFVAGTSKTTGASFSSDWVMTWGVDQNGKVDSHHLYLDTDNIARAITGQNFTQTGFDFLTAMDAGDFNKLQACVTPEFKVMHPNFPEPLKLSDFFEKQVKPFNAGIQGATHTVLDASCEGQKLTLRGVVTGNHSGSLMGEPATRNNINVPWIAFATLNPQGKMTELYVQFNQLAFLSQIGANPIAKN